MYHLELTIIQEAKIYERIRQMYIAIIDKIWRNL